MRFIDRTGFTGLLEALAGAGDDLVGPTVKDGAIVLDRIEGSADLPRGVGEIQAPGAYRLTHRNDARVFAWAHGPDSGKRFLFPSREVLARFSREDGRLAADEAKEVKRPLAFVGLRSCDLHAVAVQDRVFLDSDPSYARRREAAFFV